ncbi:hypothetical protein D9M68_504960 [compost metagenome]
MVRLERGGLDDLGQPDHLPARVGQLQAHAGLAGDGLDHTDRGHAERAGEILHQAHDLCAAHTHGGLYLEARDDRAGIGADHGDRHLELCQALRDQFAGFAKALVRHLFAAVELVFQQVGGRQAVVDRRARRGRFGNRCGCRGGLAGGQRHRAADYGGQDDAGLGDGRSDHGRWRLGCDSGVRRFC